MALVWRVRRITAEQAEEGCGVWEPFGATADIEGEEFVYVRYQVDTTTEGEPDTSKATEVTGGLGTEW